MKFPYLGVAETKKKDPSRRYRRPMASLIERQAQHIVGVLSCFDRLVLPTKDVNVVVFTLKLSAVPEAHAVGAECLPAGGARVPGQRPARRF